MLKGFTTKTLRGGIIPHHLVASDNIANFFASIHPHPKTIVLIGPNHYEKGDFNVITSEKAWKTPNGNVASDTGLIKELLDKNLVKVDDNIITNDHSVASFPSFIQYFLPETKVVPMVVKSGFSMSDTETLASYLAQLPAEVFFIASVDFSHYLPKDIAFQRDTITKKAMETKNYEAIYRLNNDYLDSPPSLVLLMKIMEKRGAKQMQIFAHTNSAEYPLSHQKSTTSHFIIGFY
jgi:MEMO1 family protein